MAGLVASPRVTWSRLLLSPACHPLGTQPPLGQTPTARLRAPVVASLAVLVASVRRGSRTSRSIRRAWFGKSNQDKFESYVAQCTNYTDRELACLPPRWRKLLKGIKAGLRIPSLVSAVQILYDDVMPLRMGADLVSRQLDQKVREVSERISSDIPDGDLFAHRELFDAIDADRSGILKKSELEAFNSAVLLGPNGQKAHDSVNAQLKNIVAGLYEAQQPIGFPEFLEGASRLICEDCGEPLSSEQTRHILGDLMPLEAESDSKHDQRFDEIVQFIRDWEKEGTHLTANGRLGTVLEGSFAAAQEEEEITRLPCASSTTTSRPFDTRSPTCAPDHAFDRPGETEESLESSSSAL